MRYPGPRTNEPTKTVYAAEPNAALREIAGRIKRLSFRDMKELHAALLGACAHSGNNLTPDAILAAADAMESA